MSKTTIASASVRPAVDLTCEKTGWAAATPSSSPTASERADVDPDRPGGPRREPEHAAEPAGAALREHDDADAEQREQTDGEGPRREERDVGHR